MLTVFIISICKPNGCIALQEFGTYQDPGKYACQGEAWMDEPKMNEWIDVVLWPWKEHPDANNTSVEPSIIIRDAYPVHQMGSVVNCIQSMGIVAVHIPAGCSCLCQPIVVGIYKPIKC
jgi:hypothetical protein